MTRQPTTQPGSPTSSDTPPFRYTASFAGEVEARWQVVWEERGAFHQSNPGEPGFDSGRPKFFCLDMFPYPSGAGLHVGHPEGYTATDIISRFRRMKGYNVLHPMGWDAFGLPAEQYAIKTGVHPAITTRSAIDNFRRQLKRLGFSYDWSREFATIDPDYYRWTQWIFLQVYHSWYDPRQRRARPISELVAEYESGAREPRLNPDAAEYAGAGDVPGGTRVGDWATLDGSTRRMLIDSWRLAYAGRQTVNWCPKLGTVLANEEVIDGKSERGGFPVFRKPMRQWLFRITAYADRLLDGLDTVDWPVSTKTMQAEWIGRSVGAEVDFPLLMDGVPAGVSVRVFTTRPDTMFGATYMVVAPEHPLVDEALSTPTPETDEGALREYVRQARNRSDVERMESRDKTGVFTGLYAQNPATGEPIPVWTSDYVLMGYGTGAIMAVPAQDQRDWDFATKYGLPIVRTVRPPEGFNGEAFTGDGPAMNSGFLDGMPVADAKKAMTTWLEERQIGMKRVNYRLRDWLFSRQRYWGEPFPIVWDEMGNHYGVCESKLPVVLPDMTDYQPEESDDPKPLLAKAQDWIATTAGEAGIAELAEHVRLSRESNTMPGWAGSCWYYLRFCDPKNSDRFVSAEAERYWMGSGVGSWVGRHSVPTDGHPIANRSCQIPAPRLDDLPRGPIVAVGFVPRDPYPPETFGQAADVVRSFRHLPHVEMPGATYFVTWRTLPGVVLSQADRDLALKSLLHFDGDRCRVYAACVMPDHVHWIVRPYDGQTLSDLCKSVKRFSAGEINAQSGSEGSVWQSEHFDHVIRDEKWFGEFLRYTVENPVKAELVSRPSEYSWIVVHVEAISVRDLQAVGTECRPTPSQDEETSQAVGTECRPTQSRGVDLYIGGAEHAVLHLLYARFWHKVLFDLGHVTTDEPFKKLFHQGLITSYAYEREDRSLVPVDEVDEPTQGTYIERATGKPVRQIVAKMSKALKNVVNPDGVIDQFGADTFRLYEMYMGPLDASKPWNTSDTVGLLRFLQRLWRVLIDEDTGALKLAIGPDAALEKLLHRTTAKVAHDIEALAFNTAIAAMIEFVNAATSSGGDGASLTRDQASRFVRVLAPFAPHMAEELWSRLGNAGLIVHQAWPEVDETMLVDSEVELAVQIKGKVRARLVVPAAADASQVERLALADSKVIEAIAGAPVRKVIVVPGRLVNIVTG